VAENLEPGADVITVTATDRDEFPDFKKVSAVYKFAATPRVYIGLILSTVNAIFLCHICIPQKVKFRVKELTCGQIFNKLLFCASAVD